MTRRRQAWLVAALLVTTTSSACERSAASAPEWTVPTPAYGAAYVDALPGDPSLSDPSGACRPAIPPGTELAPSLREEQVVAAVVCGHVTVGGEPQLVTRRADGSVLERLVTALRLGSAKTADLCDASARNVPAFAVQLQGGRWLNPTLPSDGCHPKDAVLKELRAVLAQP